MYLERDYILVLVWNIHILSWGRRWALKRNSTSTLDVRCICLCREHCPCFLPWMFSFLIAHQAKNYYHIHLISCTFQVCPFFYICIVCSNRYLHLEGWSTHYNIVHEIVDINQLYFMWGIFALWELRLVHPYYPEYAMAWYLLWEVHNYSFMCTWLGSVPKWSGKLSLHVLSCSLVYYSKWSLPSYTSLKNAHLELSCLSYI